VGRIPRLNHAARHGTIASVPIPRLDLDRTVHQLGQQLRRLPTTGREAAVLLRSGLAPPTKPHEIIAALANVHRWGMAAGPIRIAAQRHGDRAGLVDERGPLTFAELDDRSTALANAWRDRGLSDRSVIAVLARDHRGLVDTVFAAGKLGARLLLMNTGFAGPQLADVAAREGVDVLVHDSEFGPLLSGVPDSVSRYRASVEPGADEADGTLDALIATGSQAPLPRPASVAHIVLLTSGTTGAPKGAARQINSPFAAAQFLDRIPLRLNGRTLFGAPLFHATGLSQFLLAIALGSTVIVRRRFDPRQTLELVAEHRADTVVLVPTMLQRIVQLSEDEIRRYDTSTLRVIFLAGSALPPEVGNRALELFGDVVYNLYGSTEVAVATVATPADWRLAPGTVGRAPVGCRVRLYNDDGRRITEPNVTARIFVGSGLRFTGYTGGGSKDEIDDLLSSGDVGHFDEHGLLFIDGRADDMIVSGGENVFPDEVEHLLLAHESIADAAVVGVPDEDFGARLKAFVVLREGVALSADDVQAYVRAELARHKVPRDVAFVAELPRNATGKLLRNELNPERKPSG
jgi:fatty-acyl-CoA synthase